MANSYYDCTGALVLGQITPVIKALFGAFNLEAGEPGSGEVSIAKISESDSLTWDDVLDNFDTLIAQLAIPAPDQPYQTVPEYLAVLAKHFGAADDQFIADLIGQDDFDDDPSLGTLFGLADRFDDGHGMKAMKLEGCWHSDRPSLFAFGGDGAYHSRNFRHRISSSDARELGAAMDKALASDDLDAVAGRIMKEVDGILNSVTDVRIRHELTAKLASLMSPTPVIVVALEGGTIVESYGTHPARMIFLDGDTEGGDSSQVVDVFGEAKYLTDGMIDVRPHSVADVLDELAVQAPEEEEGEPEAVRP
ncbi:hypothetical protein ACFPOU_23725 [Massilia jejuensis]|uniref:Uncharacterized protein n=1 Tax=Massilia jejuensis TaxID=648894 RepID=A0ABW0PN97_9BURK